MKANFLKISQCTSIIHTHSQRIIAFISRLEFLLLEVIRYCKFHKSSTYLEFCHILWVFRYETSHKWCHLKIGQHPKAVNLWDYFIKILSNVRKEFDKGLKYFPTTFFRGHRKPCNRSLRSYFWKFIKFFSSY